MPSSITGTVDSIYSGANIIFNVGGALTISNDATAGNLDAERRSRRGNAGTGCNRQPECRNYLGW